MKAWKRVHAMRTGKIITIVLAAVVLLLSTGGAGHAIGEFAVGLNGGLASDPNNLEGEITRYNLEMALYEENNSGASSTAMAIPYAPVYGFNLRYQLNFFFLRLGCHYSSPLQDAKGSVTTAAGVKNSIKISTYQASFPATLGLLVPLNRRTHVYVGAGPTLHQAGVTITQSSPDSAVMTSLTENKRDRYSATFVGYHFILGAEVPIHEKFTLSVEWIHQEGSSHPIENDGLDKNDADILTPKRSLNVRGDCIMFGLNYYISF